MANNKVLPDFYKCWTETVIEPQTFQISVCTSVGKGGAESATLCQGSQATLVSTVVKKMPQPYPGYSNGVELNKMYR